jgi:glucosylceramidase
LYLKAVEAFLFMKTSRRNFLKVSAIGFTASTAGIIPTLSSTAFAAPTGPISVWVTNDRLKYSAAAPIAWKPASAKLPADAITLDPEKQLQEILGFGAAFTDSACYMFNELSPEAREELFRDLFDPAQMGFNVCRTCIGASDYATKAYSYDEGEPDPDLTRFSIEHDHGYILPMLREARKVNPDLFLFSSPWSPPGWMKANKSMLGVAMQRKHMPFYANYFVKFLHGYEQEGVPIQAVTVQNEVDTEQDGRMPACTWPQEYEADFVSRYLGPTFQNAGIKTRIWLIDHNYNLWGRALGELETPDVHKYANAIAWHGYVGKPEWIDRVHEKYQEVEMYWTEGGPDYTDPNYATDWCSWSKTFTEILEHWCRSITAWNFALDEQGRPNIGPFTCGGLVTIHSKTREITRSGQYWAFAHYSKAVKRGAHRLESRGGGTEVQHIAFENPDGQRVVVLTNSGTSRTVTLNAAGKNALVPLDANSITTCIWS